MALGSGMVCHYLSLLGLMSFCHDSIQRKTSCHDLVICVSGEGGVNKTTQQCGMNIGPT